MEAVVIPSQRFGRYRLTAKVGEGGLAEVFRAEIVEPTGDLRTVAVKLLKRGLREEASLWFALESGIMEALEHPNLVAKLEDGEVAGRPFLALEDVFGGTLGQLHAAHRAAGEAVPLDITLRVLIEVLKGLAYFHSATDENGDHRGLVHGDVSPANVLLSVDGSVKLGDFGLVSGQSLPEIAPGVTYGKVHYLAPEQAVGALPGPRSDLFAVGVMLFELALGFRPFDGPTDADVLEQIASCDLEGPAGIVDPELSRILQHALARYPADRPPSAGAMCGDLTRYALDTGRLATRARLAEHVVEVLGVVT